MYKLSKNHHELKISYLKHLLDGMPHGTFGERQGYKVINITYDPTDPEVSSRHKRVIRFNSSEGKVMLPIITEYQRIKNELDYLLNQWEMTYWHEPEMIEYPLRKKRRTGLTSEFFRNAKSNANPFHPEELKIEYKGQLFRSKNEMSAAQIIESMGYDFKSEVHVQIKGSENEHYPDVSFDVPELDVMLMSEIDGKLDKGNYRLKSMERQYGYFEDGFREFKDIVFMRLADPTVFDPEHYELLVKAAIEANIDDIIKG
ncbi:MAG: hypothetical protein IKP14_04570 [Clostridiales bacterium]|nr:hypothetical protein [Clostridiales bacterium]